MIHSPLPARATHHMPFLQVKTPALASLSAAVISFVTAAISLGGSFVFGAKPAVLTLTSGSTTIGGTGFSGSSSALCHWPYTKSGGRALVVKTLPSSSMATSWPSSCTRR